MSINANNAALNEILETINDLPEAGSGKEEVEKTVDINKNGETVVTPDDENTTLSKVTVNVSVPEQKEEQEKIVDITENGTTEIMPDEGKALSKVTVNVEVASSGEEGLPDWDDDSPIIASGYGYKNQTRNIWEVTEKGTMRWKIDPNGTAISGAYATAAGWSNTLTPSSMSTEYMRVANKIKQIDVSEGYKNFYLGYATNCERIRLPSTMTSFTTSSFYGLKEIIIDDTDKINAIRSSSIETLTLSPTRTSIGTTFALCCWYLRNINLENITSFGNQCFEECVNLSDLDIVFNPELISIGNKAFYRTNVKSFTFQTPTGNPPTISSTAFSQCTTTCINLYDGWNLDLTVSGCPLTQECLHDMAEKVADMTDAITQPILNIGTDNKAKMDEEHLNMLTAKNWTVS